MGRFQMGLEERQDARHGSQNGDALTADEFDDVRSGQPAFEMQLGAEDRRDPQPHGLAEDVAQRKRVQNAQGMNHPLVAHVGLGAVFDGTHAGQHIAVGQDHAFRFAGSAGSKENLQRRVRRQAGDCARSPRREDGRASPRRPAWGRQAGGSEGG